MCLRMMYADIQFVSSLPPLPLRSPMRCSEIVSSIEVEGKLPCLRNPSVTKEREDLGSELVDLGS